MNKLQRSAFLLLIALSVSCEKRSNQYAFVDAVPIPQASALEVVIDSRQYDPFEKYAWDINNLEEFVASDLISGKAKDKSNMGHDPKVQGLSNARIFDVSSSYENEKQKVGLFFGVKPSDQKSIQFQTSLPLAFGDYPVWGFEDEESHQWYRDNLQEYLELAEERVLVADFTYSRLQESYYWTISKLQHLKSLTLPFHGIDFSSKEIEFPKSLERLVIYNVRIDGNFGRKIMHLDSLKELVFIGCWLDTHATHPHWGNDRFTKLNDPIHSAFDPPVHPFDGIHANLVSLTFVDCDKKLLMATDYYTWPKLNELEVARSFEYPSEDGIMDELIYLKLKPEDSPHIHKDYFQSLSKFIYRDPSLGKHLTEFQIKSLERLQKEEPDFFVSFDKGFKDWTDVDSFALQMKRRFELNEYDFKYSISLIREESNKAVEATP